MYQSEIWVTGGFRNPYGVHQAVWRLFPGSADTRRDFLYRLEARDAAGRVRLLVQSLRRPQSGPLAQVAKLETLALSEASKAGRRRFVLVANPVRTHSRRAAGHRHGARRPLTEPEARERWFARKVAGAAEVVTLRSQVLPPIRFRKPREDFRRGCIQPVLFEGVVAVTDAARFADLLCNGIGPAKGFGCGLLTVTPAPAVAVENLPRGA
ncbi:type I-E CRISPR-associated protein Cas6/Cse3/CasE [Acanthopleuribacter pedis]|uniref:Type I-E CRISPR-associated protein Cas6/Cse3/CasE n=1 Tax=Acanthopleuribacter pedis TaxID=442870 RepID=A0A8J7QJG3_9BACT|nr:type I-E CRISPR-associated protein Cas6/Cse3/CasE [Acanthopleuribacter pedis]MBO1321971.1 type I-E CRISPR-associated protein Cas6/Cse3/CasE [Acanthopleuribacter pedis]